MKNYSNLRLRLLEYKVSPYAPSQCLMARSLSVNKYFYEMLTILLGILVSGLAFHTWVQFPGQANLQINFFSFFSLSSCCNHQTFLIRLATFKITQILSTERASERKGMSTVHMGEPILSRS